MITIKQITVHFFSLLSMDLPLFLPKNVSEEPVIALIPSELLGCIKTKMMERTDKITIAAVKTMLIIKYTVYKASDAAGASKLTKFNISKILNCFKKVFLKTKMPLTFRIIAYSLQNDKFFYALFIIFCKKFPLYSIIF